MKERVSKKTAADLLDAFEKVRIVPIRQTVGGPQPGPTRGRPRGAKEKSIQRRLRVLRERNPEPWMRTERARVLGELLLRDAQRTEAGREVLRMMREAEHMPQEKLHRLGELTNPDKSGKFDPAKIVQARALWREMRQARRTKRASKLIATGTAARSKRSAQRADQVKKLRRRFTQRQVADQLGISERTVRRLEKRLF